MNIGSFIWNIADDVLRGPYARTKYQDIILLMTVIRRLDAVLEPTKAAVLAKKVELDPAGVPEAAQGMALDRAAGQAFHNRSPFTLNQLRARSTRDAKGGFRSLSRRLFRKRPGSDRSIQAP
jgi:type I restriction enzyme M protein